jgi:hypothetical protein
MGSDAETYTRKEVTLDHAVEGGWFVTTTVAAGNYVVTGGAQTLLSTEKNPAGPPPD